MCDVNVMFGADVYHHKSRINKYILKYELTYGNKKIYRINKNN